MRAPFIPQEQRLRSRAIVGISGNVTGDPFGDQDVPRICVPRSQRPNQAATVAVQTTSDPKALRTSIAAVINALGRIYPWRPCGTMDELVGERLAPYRL